MNREVVGNVACTACGCVCDDIEVQHDGQRVARAERACTLGSEWFRRQSMDNRQPAALIHGRAASFDEALQAASELLAHAGQPLIGGLGNLTCEAQREAVSLAEAAGAVLDCHHHGSIETAMQLVGKVSCTLGEVKNRADLVVYWGCNPAVQHPRHFTRYSLTPRGRHVPRGREDRTMVVVDVQPTDSSEAADLFLQIRPGQDFEVLTLLRALVRGQSLPESSAAGTGLSLTTLADLASRLKRARYGVFFFGRGLGMTRGGHMNVAGLLKLTAELNACTRFVAVPMHASGNVAGAEIVTRWSTGYSCAVNFNRGYPRYSPGEFSIGPLLARGEVDTLLLAGGDPADALPDTEYWLTRLPAIALSPQVTSVSRLARVHITTASPLATPGTACRMDDVPVPLRPVLASSFPTEERVLRQLRQRLVERDLFALPTFLI